MRAKHEMKTKLTVCEKRASALKHYATCERLALYLGMPASRVDGKKISVALFKAENDTSKRAEQYCNGECPEGDWIACKIVTNILIEDALGKLPPGFFVNSDPRGYALKIDNESPEGKALIDAVGLQTDWGGYGLLSPEITGD